jgi:hypothetical protein
VASSIPVPVSVTLHIQITNLIVIGILQAEKTGPMNGPIKIVLLSGKQVGLQAIAVDHLLQIFYHGPDVLLVEMSKYLGSSGIAIQHALFDLVGFSQIEPSANDSNRKKIAINGTKIVDRGMESRVDMGSPVGRTLNQLN